MQPVNQLYQQILLYFGAYKYQIFDTVEIFYSKIVPEWLESSDAFRNQFDSRMRRKPTSPAAGTESDAL
jgi:hypothetical protein